MRYKQIAVKLLVIVILISVAYLNIGGCGGGSESEGGGGVFVCPECFTPLNNSLCVCSCTDLPDGTSRSCKVCSFLGLILENFCEISKSPCPTSPCPADNQSIQIVSTPELLIPIESLVITQNNPNIGCPPDPDRGFGYSIFFDWTDSNSPNGIKGYHLFATNINAMFPIIDIFVLDSNFTETSCNSFVIDSNLNDWIWTVQAEDNLGNLSSVTTYEFMFPPCRLDDGTPCNAPE